MSFAGESVIANGLLLLPPPPVPSAAIYSSNGSWYHLLPPPPVKAHLHFSFVDEVDQQEPARIRAQQADEFHRSGLGHGCYTFIKVEDLEQSKHFKDDSFTIRCDFVIPQAAANFIEVGADVTFEVGSETFAAHRCVLASRSAVFMAELFGPMKEGTTTAGAIQIQDMEANVFKALLGFIYTDSMPKMEVEAPEAGSDVAWLQHLLVAADRYDLQRLRSMCEKRLSEHIDMSSVTTILCLAVQHHSCGLKEACLEFLKVQSSKDLGQIMATSDWEHIAANPSVMNELVIKLASRV
ncbi:BTB/POZ and MATH domain-containing protein 2-like [Triticum dicoccoides]|uniref:BTB/POZ and MATH domain-containing protein 2-like n=1 Tax=Triticum dicoccoides TaxID=85692 RepID=UPI00188E3644|nr:BTB/POZ and MATH domain-containing protein 2-like [Triticum dicoccoides]